MRKSENMRYEDDRISSIDLLRKSFRPDRSARGNLASTAARAVLQIDYKSAEVPGEIQAEYLLFSDRHEVLSA